MTQLIQGYPCDEDTELKYSPMLKNTLLQQTILVPGGGCSYYRAMKGNACTFCSFPQFTRQVNMGSNKESYFGSWKLEAKIYQTMFDSLTVGNNDVDKLAIFNGGSFFPNSELPTEFQAHVYKHVAEHPNVKQLLVEAYPRFINRNHLENALSKLKGKDLVVAIGFESSNDSVRNNLLNKGIDLKLFEDKIKLMQELGVKTSIYVFLKAPQLTEYQAYQDVIATLSYLNNLGVDEMVLSSAFIPAGTDLEKLYNANLFSPPWLWTIHKLASYAEKKGWPFVIGGFDDTPTPIAGPSNCEKCDPAMLEIIAHSRLNGQLPKIALPECGCKTKWMQEFENTAANLRIL